MSRITEVTKDNFQQEVIESSLPILLDFYTDHCGPCISLAHVLEELSEKYEGKVRFAKFYVSTEEVLANSNEVVNKYDVMGFPTVLIMNNGEVLTSLLGGQTKETIQEALATI